MRGKSFGTVASPVQRIGAPTGGGPLKLLSSETISTPGTFTRTPPSGASILVARAYGGGGSGSCRNGNSGALTGGGNGGDYASGTALVSSSSSVTVSVGSGGTGVTSAGTTNGNAGGNSTVAVDGATIVTASGGPGGTSSGVIAFAALANAGQDLTGAPLTSSGRPGQAATNATDAAAGRQAAGPQGGAGGAFTTNAAAGNPGMAPGGGGSSAVNVPNTTTPSGNGAPGAVTLSWYGPA